MAVDSYETGPVRFAYEKQLCLDSAGFEIPRGQVTVVAGENGSGKTTLLKLIAGLLNVSGDANSAPGLENLRLHAVYLHQTPYLFRGTVLRNLSLAVDRPRGAEAQRQMQAAVHQALATVGLTGFGDRRTQTLSGGEQKRVALARVLLTSKPLLLLDEPAAHADESSVFLIEKACRAFAAAGRSVVIATHRGSFAYRVADRLYDLRAGELTQNPTNILPGETLHSDDGFLYFQCGDTRFRVPVRDGEFNVAVVAAEDIILSRHPLESSARNCLAGFVGGLETTGEGAVRAQVNCGVVLTSIVTPSAVDDLGLVPGAEVYATFKASSVQLY